MTRIEDMAAERESAKKEPPRARGRGTVWASLQEFANPAVYVVEGLLVAFILYKISSARRGRELFIRRIPGPLSARRSHRQSH